MDFPTNCSNCGFRNRCNASMYASGCHFFGPEDKLKTFSLKRFLARFSLNKSCIWPGSLIGEAPD